MKDRDLKVSLVRDFIATAIFVVTGTVFVVLIDFYDFFYNLTRNHEIYEIDEILIFLPFFCTIGLMWWVYRRLQNLKDEIIRRKRTEELLQKARSELEKRVDERTESLTKANKQLSQEIEERKQAEKERERMIGELQDALTEVKTLRGFLPICANCKRIRDDKGYWEQIEKYIQEHSDAQFSHSICPECAKKLYPEITMKDDNT